LFTTTTFGQTKYLNKLNQPLNNDHLLKTATFWCPKDIIHLHALQINNIHVRYKFLVFVKTSFFNWILFPFFFHFPQATARGTISLSPFKGGNTFFTGNKESLNDKEPG